MIDLVSSTGDELLTLHYALNHTMRKWLTRASTYHLIADRESLRGLELLAERLTLAGGSSTEELDPVARASLLSFTRGLPSGSWSSLKASPWGDINGTDPTLVVESALLAAERLNLANSDEAYICAVLLTWQVLAPIEGGRVGVTQIVTSLAHKTLSNKFRTNLGRSGVTCFHCQTASSSLK